MRPRHRIVRRGEAPHHRPDEVADVGRRLDLLGPWPGDRDVPRCPLLEQQVGGFHDGLSVKARPHGAVMQHVRYRDQGHALVVRHVGAHEAGGFAFRQTGGRVVERLVESVGPAGAEGGEPLEVLGRGAGIDHRRQGGRVGRDHEVLAEAALEPQARNTEVRVLICQLEVPRVEGGLGDAPGHTARRAIAHLAADDEAIALLEEAPGRRPHDERRHQVLEHRARPGDERRAPLNGRHGAPELEPVGGRDVTLGNGDEAGQTRLRGEKVIAVRVWIALGHAIADREKVARGIKEKAELHSLEELAREPGEGEQATDERAAGVGGALETLGERGVPGAALQLGERRSAPVRHLGRRRHRGEEAVVAVVLTPGKRPGQQSVHVTRVTLHGGGDGPRPREQLRRGPVAALGVQCPRHVDQGVGQAIQLAEAARPGGRRVRRRTERGRQGLDGVGELPAGDGLRAPIVRERRGGLTHEPESVVDARQRARTE